MMYGYSLEEQNKAAENTIKDYRFLASLYGEIKPVIVKFDGKVFNCRLEKALNEINPEHRYWCKVERNHVSINIHTPNMSAYKNIMWVELPENKRINADVFLSDIRSRREGFLKTANEIQLAMPEIERIKKQVHDLESCLKGILHGINYETADIYRLHYTIRNY